MMPGGHGGGRGRLGVLDLILPLTLALFTAYTIHLVRTRLNYNWAWATIPQYILRRDPATGRLVPNLLLQGLFTTIRLSLWSSVLALLLGTAVAILRLRHGLFERVVSRAYVELLRNMPPLVLVFIFYFFLGHQLTTALRLDYAITRAGPNTVRVLRVLMGSPARIPEFVSAVFTLAVFESAYIAEIIRSGIQSVHRGQWEAGHSLGLSRFSQYRDIILPQALRSILPALSGQFISTVKDSSIVAVISVQELTFQGLELMSATYRTFEVWITITILYLVLTGTLSFGARKLEQHLRGKGTR